MLTVSERWRNNHRDAMVGVLVVKNVVNVAEHPELERRKRALEAEVRVRFRNPDDVKADRVVRAYITYYRRYEKTYHLVQQVKTLVAGQRPLPSVSGLVDVMFMAEMKNLLLTAGHDLSAVMPPVTLDAAGGDEEYVKLNREPQMAKKSDMMVRDRQGILSSIIHGPDYRSRITIDTRAVMYVVYAPSGIDKTDIVGHARDIAAGILTFSPGALVQPLHLVSAEGADTVSV